MSIRYNKEYNKEITNVVKNFNQKRYRAIKRGFKDVPVPVKVSDLKARYTSRKELNKQLTILKKFGSNPNILKQVENQGGAKSTKWNWNYLKSNVSDALEYYKREYELIARKVGEFPGERIRLDNIAQKINTLELDTAYMSQSQFNSYQSAISNYLSMPSKIKGGYRGFLTEVELVMRRLGYSNSDVNKVFDKLKVLSPHQFHQLYEENDLVGRIYEIVKSPTHGASQEEIELTTDEEDAEDLLNAFLEELDEDVAKYKNR